MNASQATQRGASTIGLIIILAIIGVGTYIGLQYVPQFIECGTVDTILGNLERANEEKPVKSINEVRNMIDRQLNINQMEDLRDSFEVTQIDETYTITVNYERELDLIYEKKPMVYEKSVTLR